MLPSCVGIRTHILIALLIAEFLACFCLNMNICLLARIYADRDLFKLYSTAHGQFLNSFQGSISEENIMQKLLFIAHPGCICYNKTTKYVCGSLPRMVQLLMSLLFDSYISLPCIVYFFFNHICLFKEICLTIEIMIFFNQGKKARSALLL